MSRLQERNSCVLQGGGLAWDFCVLYLDIDTLVWYGLVGRSCLFFFFPLGSVSHTQAPTSTIVTMTMPSHSSHATAVTTSNIPVGE